MAAQLSFGLEPRRRELAPGAHWLGGLACDDERALLEALESVLVCAPLRHMFTPGGFRMSVAMSNCGQLGWVTDRSGYRYSPHDPESGRSWPEIPAIFAALAHAAAEQAGYPAFAPDACLINQYAPGARMSLHRDENETDRAAPIVSVSLGLPARFLFGGLARSERPRRILLEHGDVVVWGGPSRLRFHGILPLGAGEHELLGRRRINLTFRVTGLRAG